MLTNNDSKGKVLRILPYSRVSTLDQAREGTSMGTQKEELERFAKAQGWQVLDEHIEDAGESGAHFNRPGIRKMLGWVRRGVVDLVVVSKIDRFGRDTYEGLKLFREELEPRGVHIVSLDGVDSRTPQGQFMLELMLAVARQDRVRILERTRGGLIAAAKEGRWPGGRRPFGFSWCRESGKWKVIPEEVAIVRKVYEWYLSGLSTHKIAKGLFAQGFKTKATKKYPGGCSAGPTWISRILASSAYTGSMEYTLVQQKFTLTFPPIITSQDFAAVQAKLKAGALKSSRGRKREILSAGYVFCGECDTLGRAAIRMFTGKVSFTCGTHLASIRHRPDQHKYRHEPCENVSVPIDQLDSYLWSSVCRLLLDNRWRLSILSGAAEEAQERLSLAKADMDSIQGKLDRNREEQVRQLRLCSAGALSEDILAVEGARLKAERKALEGELARIQGLHEEAAAASRATQGPRQFQVRKLDTMPYSSRRELLDILFPDIGDGIYARLDGTAEIRAKWAADGVEEFLLADRAGGEMQLMNADEATRAMFNRTLQTTASSFAYVS